VIACALSLTVSASADTRLDSVEVQELLVGNSTDSSVLSYNGETGVFQRVFVPAGSGGLDNPQNITIGPDGNLYVSSWATHSIKRYDGQTGVYVDDFVPPGSGGLANPDQVIFGPDGHLYVSNRFNAAITRYDGQSGAFLGAFVTDVRLGGFVGFTFGPDGNIYAGMFNGNQKILRFSGATGAFMDVFNSGDPSLNSAFAGLVFGPDGHLYASRMHADLVERYNGTTGEFIDTFVPEGSGGLNAPDYLVFGPDDNLYVASMDSRNILRYNGATGAFVDIFTSGGPPIFPKGLAFFTPTSHFVGGAITGIESEKGLVVCRNKSTHKTVIIPITTNAAWDCESAGLEVFPGDKIRIWLHVKGTAK
jgi:streptogramin lyase